MRPAPDPASRGAAWLRRGVALSALAAVGCGGSSGGGPALPAPVILTAAFVGAGSSPAPGDTLILLMSQDVSVSGAILDDQDVTLSSGSLGAVTIPPVLVTSRAVQITLGVGVSFAPATTTIEFGAANDAVRGAANGQLATGGMVTITAGDGDNPSITLLTIANVDAELNGTGGAGGTLQAPQAGFSITVRHTDPSSAINTAATVITSSQVIGGIAAGGNLTGLFSATPGAASSSFFVPGTAQFPAGAVTITAVVVDITGMSSSPVSFSFTTRAIDDTTRPFPTTVNASQVWFLDLSRDLESYTFVGGGSNPVRVDAGASGTPDLEELFSIVGLFGSDPSVNNTVMESHIKPDVLTQLGLLFGSANISFTYTSPGTFPGTTTVAYNTLGFSQICIAGAASASGVLGLAIFDPNNTTQDNNCETAFGAMNERLGVFMHTLVDSGMLPSSTTFRATFDALAPGLGGTPIGTADVGILANPSGPGQRTTDIHNAIERMTRSIALITAHECGHSVGLVRDGAMPTGLYGGNAANFPLPSGVNPASAPGHIANISLFPAGAENVMSPGLSFPGMINTSSVFNTLNMAYLLETVLYNP